jgi:hypothetical protein
MAQQLKILGQVSPTANTDTPMYAPGNTVLGFVCSSIVICNTDANEKTFRIYVRPAGAAAGAATALVYDMDLGPNAVESLQLGVAGSGTNGDIIGVRASATGVTFTAFGQELS